MSDKHKQSTQRALEKYLERTTATPKPRRAPNKTPEADVVKEIIKCLRENKFIVQVIEAKATWSHSSGGYRSSAASPGTSDLVGVAPNGIAVFIEVKAKGRRRTLKPHQCQYLIERIKVGAFGACCDSVKYFHECYSTWIGLNPGSEIAKSYLISQLYQKGISSDESTDGALF